MRYKVVYVTDTTDNVNSDGKQRVEHRNANIGCNRNKTWILWRNIPYLTVLATHYWEVRSPFSYSGCSGFIFRPGNLSRLRIVLVSLTLSNKLLGQRRKVSHDRLHPCPFYSTNCRTLRRWESSGTLMQRAMRSHGDASRRTVFVFSSLRSSCLTSYSLDAV